MPDKKGNSQVVMKKMPLLHVTGEESERFTIQDMAKHFLTKVSELNHKPKLKQDEVNVESIYAEYRNGIVDPHENDILFPSSFEIYFAELLSTYFSEQDNAYVISESSLDLESIHFESKTGVKWSVSDLLRLKHSEKTKPVRFKKNTEDEWVLGARFIESFPVTFGVTPNSKSQLEPYVDIAMPEIPSKTEVTKSRREI